MTNRRSFKNLNLLDSSNEFKLSVFILEYLPKFATIRVVITDDDYVYAINGSDCVKIDFIEELESFITSVPVNVGWLSTDEVTGQQHLQQVIDLLYQKNYIGQLTKPGN